MYQIKLQINQDIFIRFVDTDNVDIAVEKIDELLEDIKLNYNIEFKSHEVLIKEIKHYH